MYRGVDLGTRFGKTDNGVIFASGISTDIKNMANNVMILDGKSYTMELFNQKSNYDINMNKTLNNNARLNFVYALYKSTKDDMGLYKGVIVGLPASQCTENNIKKYKEILRIEEPIEVSVNDIKKTILVEEIEIVAEGSTAYYAMNYEQFNKRKTLILDWGGLTLNQHLFLNDENIESYTDEYGSLKIYRDMAGEISSKTGKEVNIEEMDDVILYGLSIQGKIVSVKDYIKEIALDYCKKVYKNLQLKWNIDTIPFVRLVGGTSIFMAEYFKEYVPHAILEDDAQFLSAKGMGIVARMCWGNEF